MPTDAPRPDPGRLSPPLTLAAALALLARGERAEVRRCVLCGGLQGFVRKNQCLFYDGRCACWDAPGSFRKRKEEELMKYFPERVKE